MAYVANVFEVTNKPIHGELGTITKVISIRHYPNDSIDIIEKPMAFWVSDLDLYQSYDSAQISFEDAYNSLKSQTTYPIPHSVHATLRQTIGPNKCAPQYIMGNKEHHLFIDSYTGTITDIDPSDLPDYPDPIE